eukprot:COSAG01_NODE_54139_length_334_cov_0.706383_1_plen_40_part_10
MRVHKNAAYVTTSVALCEKQMKMNIHQQNQSHLGTEPIPE